MIGLQVSLKREAKYLCPDLSSIRGILEEFGAIYSTTKKQTDHIFRIFDPRSETNSKRVKVRIENDISYSIYIYSRQVTEVNVEFDYFEVQDPQIIGILSSVFGKAKIINKKREVWKKENFIFHLDEVVGVGGIFEIELVGQFESNGYEKLINECLSQLKGCSLTKIQGSNEDIVPDDEDYKSPM